MNPEPLTKIINKSIHGTYISLDKRLLVRALREHRLIRVTILDQKVTADIDPQVWWDTANKREKRVMKYKNNPMTLVYNTVPVKSFALRNKDVVPNQLSLV